MFSLSDIRTRDHPAPGNQDRDFMTTARLRRLPACNELVFLVALLAGWPVTTRPVTTLADERPDATDKLFRHWNTETSPGAAIAVLQDGKVIYSSGYGMANLEHGIANTPDSVFHVASVSKQFTAFAIFLLQEDGKLSLDDDIRKHLPDLPDFGKTIRIRNLVHHTSGLRDQWELLILAGWRMDDVITHDDVMELVRMQRELNFAPGDQYLYCNTGYTLLAEIVKRVSGQSLREFCQNRIFDPLEMKHTHFHDDHRHIVKNRTDCYSHAGPGWRKEVLSYAIVGATSLLTTAGDLVRWQQNFQTRTIGGDEVFQHVFERGVLNNGEKIVYAGGLYYGKLAGHETVGHSGGDAAYRCHVLRVPARGLSVIVLANAGNMPTATLANRIATLYLKESPPPTDEADADPSHDRANHPAPGRGKSKNEVAPSGSPGSLKPLTPWQLASQVRNSRNSQNSRNGNADSAAETPVAPDHEPFCGTYYCPELDVSYTFKTTDDGDLVLERRKYGTQKCRGRGDDRFVVHSGLGMLLEFVRDAESGKVVSLRISCERIRKLKFVRKSDS